MAWHNYNHTDRQTISVSFYSVISCALYVALTKAFGNSPKSITISDFVLAIIAVVFIASRSRRVE